MCRNRFLVTILIFACYIRISAQSELVLSNAEKRVDNCALMLDMTINNAFNNQPIIDVRAFADTLYQDLYTRPVDIRSSINYTVAYGCFCSGGKRGSSQGNQ